MVAVPFGYWWYVTVPEARLDLSKDKRKGGMRSYIDELRIDEDPRPAERWFFKKYLDQLPDKPLEAPSVVADPSGQVSSDTTDSGREVAEPSIQELFRPATLKGNATPKFWSGDNPIVVTMSSLLVIGVIATGARTNAALTADAIVLTLGIAFGVSRLTLD